MANPTLTKGGVPNFLSSGNTILTLFNAETEGIRKVTDTFTLNMPASDSNESLAFDLFGTRREVTLNGRVTLDDVPDLWKFAYDIVGLKQTVSATDYDTLVNGSQGDTGGGQVGYIFTSQMLTAGVTPNTIDELRQIRVYVTDSNANFNAGDVEVYWSFTMVEISPNNSG